jgi:Asp-tRNA(Asn)/Glu-tRNA(Gln) amidotransferase C subunit
LAVWIGGATENGEMEMTGNTKLSDVCGTIDEMKCLLHEEHAVVAANPAAAIAPLLADALFMLDRMEVRMAEYEDFRSRLARVLSALERVESVDRQPADDAAEFLRQSIRSEEAFRQAAVEEMGEAGEAIRVVAGTQEDRLRAFMDLALEAGRLFDEIRGNRPWLMGEVESADLAEEIGRKYQAWMPPEPHRTELLKFVATSRATVLPPTEPGTSPVVQFYGGGAIPLSLVRYDPAIENFHPASFRPGPTGRSYRKRKA